MTFSLQQTWNTNKSKEQIALKPNQIKGKVTRYESYKDFLTHCIAEELISKGLETWIRADKWKLWLKVCRQKVFQIQRFSAYTNERHSKNKNTENTVKILLNQQMKASKILKRLWEI